MYLVAKYILTEVQLSFSDRKLSSSHGQNSCHFADDTFRYIFVNEEFSISVQISPRFVPKDLIDNNPAMV